MNPSETECKDRASRVKKAMPLPISLISEALWIDPTSKTGLRWKIRPRNHFNSDKGWRRFNAREAGRAAGGKRSNGRGKQYCIIHIGNMFYRAHRIVYALAHNVDPGEMQIDHIDGNEQNNNPANLRLANNTENQWNRGKSRNNKSGFKGVCWDNARQRWRAQIQFGGRDKHLGYFHNINEASAAYEAASREHFGEFYRPS